MMQVPVNDAALDLLVRAKALTEEDLKERPGERTGAYYARLGVLVGRWLQRAA
jgi:hypothetical protein